MLLVTQFAHTEVLKMNSTKVRMQNTSTESMSIAEKEHLKQSVSLTAHTPNVYQTEGLGGGCGGTYKTAGQQGGWFHRDKGCDFAARRSYLGFLEVPGMYGQASWCYQV